MWRGQPRNCKLLGWKVPAFIFLLTLLVLSSLAFHLGRKRALNLASGHRKSLHSLPEHYGFYLALYLSVPASIVFFGWYLGEAAILEWLLKTNLPENALPKDPAQLSLFFNNLRNNTDLASSQGKALPALAFAIEYYQSLSRLSELTLIVALLGFGALGLTIGWRTLKPSLKARVKIETFVRCTLIISSIIAVLATVGIVLSLLFESLRFFQLVSPMEFLFGLEWSPQIALREDQVASAGKFGAIPLFVGTLLISFIAICIAAPVGLMAAIYMAEYASSSVRAFAKPLLEILAGIPTVVYGFFAALTVAPLFRDWADQGGFQISSESALAAGVVMGVMIIPFVSSLSDDVITAVPNAMRDGSLGLGATRSETIRQVVVPAALPGIVGGLLLAISRAIGETMIVVMAAGLAANLTANPFEAVTTVTVQIVTLLIGDQEFDSAKTLAAFALGLVLFFVTLILNVIALRVVQKYREKYD